jgi:hypothetical protein
MTLSRCVRTGLWSAGALLAGVCAAQPVLLPQMPAGGEIPYGKVVLVDDGKCPDGQVREVTGGSNTLGVPRRVRCVPRPAGAPPR